VAQPQPSAAAAPGSTIWTPAPVPVSGAAVSAGGPVSVVVVGPVSVVVVEPVSPVAPVVGSQGSRPVLPPTQVPQLSVVALPPQSPWQSWTQSMTGSASQVPHMSSVAMPPGVPSQSTTQSLAGLSSQLPQASS
jgi:hypothetical protein